MDLGRPLQVDNVTVDVLNGLVHTRDLEKIPMNNSVCVILKNTVLTTILSEKLD